MPPELPVLLRALERGRRPPRRVRPRRGGGGPHAPARSGGRGVTPRPQQGGAVDAVGRHIAASETKPAVVLATGSGKTHVTGELCRGAVRKWNGRVVVLAHVKERL